MSTYLGSYSSGVYTTQKTFSDNLGDQFTATLTGSTTAWLTLNDDGSIVGTETTQITSFTVNETVVAPGQTAYQPFNASGAGHSVVTGEAVGQIFSSYADKNVQGSFVGSLDPTFTMINGPIALGANVDGVQESMSVQIKLQQSPRLVQVDSTIDSALQNTTVNGVPVSSLIQTDLQAAADSISAALAALGLKGISYLHIHVTGNLPSGSGDIATTTPQLGYKDGKLVPLALADYQNNVTSDMQFQMTINLNPSDLQKYYSGDPDQTQGGDSVDVKSILAHEIMHGLGIADYGLYNDKAVRTAWGSFVQQNPDGTFTYVGPSAQVLLATPKAPATPDGSSLFPSHLGNIGFPDLLQQFYSQPDPTNHNYVGPGTPVSGIDAAILKDIGYNIPVGHGNSGSDASNVDANGVAAVFTLNQNAALNNLPNLDSTNVQTATPGQTTLTVDRNSSYTDAGDGNLTVFGSFTPLGGTPHNDTIVLGSGNKTVNLGRGSELVSVKTGAGGNIIINGSIGQDAIFAGLANVTLFAGSGSDLFVGGGGNDTLSYSNVGGGGFVFDLGAGTVTKGGTVDTFSGVNLIVGSIGNDHFVGGPGSHTINGGGGTNDMLDYSGAPGPVTVNMVNGTAQNGYGGGDAFSNIQIVYASNHGSAMIGGSGGPTTEILHGGTGNDAMIGGAAGDVLFGGAAADDFILNSAAYAAGVAGAPDTIADYDQGNSSDRTYTANEGDQIDLTALVNGALFPAGSIVRAVDDPSGAYVDLQVDTNAQPGNWVTVAHVSNLHVGDTLRVIIDNANPQGTTIGIQSDSGFTGDFNGDGFSDVLLQNDNGTLAMGELNGSQLIANPGLGNPGPTWHIVGIGDFNGDHTSDLLFRNDNGTLGIWEMNGGQIVGTPGIGNPGSTWKVAAVADFNGDGQSDILLQNTNGTLGAWEIKGGQVVATPGFGNPGPSWHVVGTGDFNQDGKADVLLRNDNGTLVIWETDGTSVIATPTLGNPGASWHVIGTGDFFGRGFAGDILFQNDNGTLGIWEMSGGQILVAPGIGNPGPSWHVVGTGDYNHDGHTDLMFRNDNGMLAMWELNGGQIIGSAGLWNAGTNWTTITHQHDFV